MAQGWTRDFHVQSLVSDEFFARVASHCCACDFFPRVNQPFFAKRRFESLLTQKLMKDVGEALGVAFEHWDDGC